MTYDEIKAAWNAQADEHNQWDSLSDDEKVEWAARLAAAKTAQLATVTAAPSDETLRLAGIIADKIEDGTLFQAGIFSRRDLADKVRAVVRAARYGAQPAAGTEADRQQRGGDVEAVLRRFLTGDGFIAECDITHIVAALIAQPQETIAYVTRNEEGDPAMLFFDLQEARLYCEPGEEPEALVLAGSGSALQSQDQKDAARYRLLRRKVCIVGGKFHILNLDPRYIAPDVAVELDAAIDAAITAQAKQGGAV